MPGLRICGRGLKVITRAALVTRPLRRQFSIISERDGHLGDTPGSR
jgi:hypothetical protein